jgi:protein SCO1
MSNHEHNLHSDLPGRRSRGRWTLGLYLVAAAGGAAYLLAATHRASTTGAAQNAALTAATRPELELGRSELHDYDPPEPGTYSLPVLKEAADGAVLDSAGRARSLRELLAGRVTILSFVYLRCASPHACPYATGVLGQIHAVTCKDPVLAERLQLINMSFDPEHDTPQRMAAYGDLFRGQGGADWRFLTTRNEATLKPILQAYDQTVDRKANMNDPLGPYYHPVRVYLIDRNGCIRNIYSFGMLDPRMLVTDARTLIAESQ